ncbi:MAG: hypothetical protein U5R46_12760 [Gammaproteobacteria bacterium]|nr:hypothetical protein [Gammaproteobacteria bacterium]
MTKPLDLTPDKALIFRITHRDNVPWIMDPLFDDHMIQAAIEKLADLPAGRRAAASGL